MRILIVDQLQDQRTLLRVMCSGHWVKECKHSTEALNKAKDFDVILTEVWFSGLAGQDYLDQLRKRTKGRIIVVTSQVYEEYEADVVIHKPYHKRQIMEAINNTEHENNG